MNQETETKRKCANPSCGKDFAPKKKWQKFCAPPCSNKIRMERYWAKRVGAPAHAPA